MAGRAAARASNSRGGGGGGGVLSVVVVAACAGCGGSVQAVARGGGGVASCARVRSLAHRARAYHRPVPRFWCVLLALSRSADRDGDGHIEPKEIKSVMSNLGCPQSDEQIKALIASVDTDGNGKIEFDEFVGIMAARMLKKDGDSEIEQAFGLFDDGSGYVSVDTIRTMLMQMGSHSLPREEVDALLSMMQVDAEGRVTMDDFRDLPCWEVPMPNGRPSMKPAPRKPVAAPVAAPQQPVRTTEAPAPAAPPPPAEAEPAAEPPAKPDEAKPDEGAAAAEGEAAPAAE